VILVDSGVWIDFFRNKPTRTVDVLIATRCLANGLRLLHRDRDFDAFEQHLGLRVVYGGT